MNILDKLRAEGYAIETQYKEEEYALAVRVSKDDKHITRYLNMERIFDIQEQYNKIPGIKKPLTSKTCFELAIIELLELIYAEISTPNIGSNPE